MVVRLQNGGNMEIAEQIYYVGTDDREIDLFESQYAVPKGISYNSYLIMDEKIALLDTVDARKTEEWLENVKKVLGTRTPDYLIISHMEPDHAGSIMAIAEEYPMMKLVGNAKTFPMLEQFFPVDFEDRKITVVEGDSLLLGSHTLRFFMAPMVHWPEVMVSYEETEKILFSADGFGKFGALDTKEGWVEEARRYYINIVGKYGMQVQALLKKAADLDIRMICPLHGPVLKDDLEFYIEKYDIWSSYRPEEKGVLVAYASIHGNTAKAAKELAGILAGLGEEKVEIADLSRTDIAKTVADAFRYDAVILACPTYDGGLFPCMEDFLAHLKAKNYQKRTVGLVENGTWAPMAAKFMKTLLEGMKEIKVVEPTVSIRSALNEQSGEQLRKLAEEIHNR